jgi:hypothetical protein
MSESVNSNLRWSSYGKKMTSPSWRHRCEQASLRWFVGGGGTNAYVLGGVPTEGLGSVVLGVLHPAVPHLHLLATTTPPPGKGATRRLDTTALWHSLRGLQQVSATRQHVPWG